MRDEIIIDINGIKTETTHPVAIATNDSYIILYITLLPRFIFNFANVFPHHS